MPKVKEKKFGQHNEIAKQGKITGTYSLYIINNYYYRNYV